MTRVSRIRQPSGATWALPAEEISAVGMCQMLVSYLRDGAYYPLGSTQAFSNALARSLLNEGAHVLLGSRRGRRSSWTERALRGSGLTMARRFSARGGEQRGCPTALRGYSPRRRVPAGAPTDSLTPGGPLLLWPVPRRIGQVEPRSNFRGAFTISRGARSGRGGVDLSVGHNALRRQPSAAGAQIISMTVGVPPSSPAFVAWQGDKRGHRSRRSSDIWRLESLGCPSTSSSLKARLPGQSPANTLARDGAAYGWAVLPDQAGDNRLPSETSLGGLYLTGQWTSPGPGVAAVAASGWSASQRSYGG